MIPRIRQRSALFRQVQAFFQQQLAGVYSWEAVETRKAQAVIRDTKPNGTPLPYEAGKVHDKIEMFFGPFDLVVLGPFEDEKYPQGLIKVSTPRGAVEGPLDSATWDRVGAFIKENKPEEPEDGRAAGTHWGR